MLWIILIIALGNEKSNHSHVILTICPGWTTGKRMLSLSYKATTPGVIEINNYGQLRELQEKMKN